MKNNVKTSNHKIRSLRELQSEKLRLKDELRKTEESMNSDYHHILEAFSFRNILKTVTNDISMTSTAFSKAFSIGKNFFGKMKKKKKKNKTQQADTEEIKQGEQPPDL